MNILIVLNGFFPGQKYGGPPVSINNFCSLMKGHNCYIIAKDHDFGEKKRYSCIEEGWNDRENCRVLYLNDRMFNQEAFLKEIKRLNPDILYLQSFFEKCVYSCLRFAKKNNYRVLLAPRGELCEGAINIKRSKKLLYIKFMKMLGMLKNTHFQSTSENESFGIATFLGINKERIHFLNNIPSLPQKDYDYEEKKTGEGRFIFLSRIHTKKNLLSAIRFFESIKGNAIFHIYGPIEDEEYWGECKAAIDNLPDNIKVEYKGLVSHELVHETFSKYDAFLFPTLSENYGHVIAESLSVGTIVITSNQTPWLDLEEKQAGWSIDLSNSKGFIDALQYIVDKGNDFVEMRCKAKAYFCEYANIQFLKQEYEDTLNIICNQ